MSFFLKRKWTRKPDQSIQIDWSNPLAKGLVACVILNGQQPVDLVDGSLGTRAGGVTSDTYDSDGLLYSFDGTDSQITFGDKDRYSVATGKMTVFAKASNLTSGLIHPLFTKYDNAIGAFSGEFALGTTATNTLGLQILDGAYNVRCRMESNAAVSLSGTYAASWDNSGVDEGITLYMDGVTLPATGGGEDASFVNAENTDSELRIGVAVFDEPAYDNWMTGDVSVALLWNRELSAAEHKAIADNPYQILKPKTVYIPIVGGAGPITFAASNNLSLTNNANLSTAINLASSQNLSVAIVADLTTAIQLKASQTFSLNNNSALQTDINFSSNQNVSLSNSAALSAGSGFAVNNVMSLNNQAILNTGIELKSNNMISINVQMALSAVSKPRYEVIYMPFTAEAVLAMPLSDEPTATH